MTDTYRNPRPQITCARRRGPQAIAADIQRRLLPDVEESYPKECAYIQRSNAHRRLQQQTRQVLAQAGQGHVVEKTEDTVCSIIPFGTRPPWTARVSANPQYGVEIRISYLDLETAAQILELLATAPASNGADCSPYGQVSNP